MLGEKVEFSLDKFQLSWKERDAIGIVFLKTKEIQEFYQYMDYIKFDMSILPAQNIAESKIQRAKHHVIIWKNVDDLKHSVSQDLPPAYSDYYYKDINFPYTSSVAINTVDLMDFLTA